MKSVSFLGVLAATATALQITEPGAGEAWDLSQTNTIKWTFVNTDPTDFQLALVDKSTTPETDTVIAASVKTSDGKYDLTNFVAKPGDKYTIKAFSTAKLNTGQLAESQTFNVTKSGVASSTSASVPSSTSSGSAATATKTNAAAALGQAFGVAGPLAVIFAIFL